MVEITGKEFEKRIKSLEGNFNDLIVNLDKNLDFKITLLNNSISFKNITFRGMKVIFSDFNRNEISTNNNLSFENCLFLCDFLFDSCNLNLLTFISCTIDNKLFQIRRCNINYVSFEEKIESTGKVIPNIVKSSLVKINNGNINHLDFENIQFSGGALKISGQKSIKSFSIVRSILNYVVISNCNFNEHFDYIGNDVIPQPNNSFFNNCTFNNSSFSETRFNNDTHFSDCIFNKSTNFQSIGNQSNVNLKFTSCDFQKFTDFDKSRIQRVRFEKIKFHDFVSFQETSFDIIEIDKTNFEKGAFFDDIQIKKIDDCDRRTIRTIKQQLQKTENKIDYNRFRVYEFNSYRKDIKKKLKEFEKDKDHLNHRLREPIQLKRDASILWISDIVSEYGTDWKRAIKFTLLTGFVIYILFFICENYEYKTDILDWENLSRFTSGLFRFFLVTDFFNPLDNHRTYLTNPLSWLVFILGKIIIAFGIYETIQSFRKFKA